MQLKTYRRVTDGFLISRVAGETVLMDARSGEYFGINKVGTAIWELLENPLTLEALVEHLLGVYAVDPAVCIAEVDQFLSLLQAKKMLLIEE